MYGPIFRSARNAAGLSARAVAARVGISHSTVSLWERGKRDIADETYHRLSSALTDYMSGRWAA